MGGERDMTFKRGDGRRGHVAGRSGSARTAGGRWPVGACVSGGRMGRSAAQPLAFGWKRRRCWAIRSLQG